MRYYSDMLEKFFDKEEDLEAAEKAEEEKKALVVKEKELRQKDVEGVQTAANEYLNLVVKNNEIRDKLREEEEKLYNAYRQELIDFSKKHKNYHLSYTSDGKNVEFKVEESRYASAREYMIEQRNLMSKMIEQFFKSW